MSPGLLEGLFAPRPAKLAGRKLFAAVSAQARSPVLYSQGEAPDTPEGRFEIYALHVLLVLHRLKGEGPRATETAQALFDTFLKNLDEGLREMGVGDLSVGRKMRKLGEAIYGRVKGYDAALQELPDEAALRRLIGRTLFADEAAVQSGPIARYAAASSDRLRAQPLDQVLDGELSWPEFGREP